MSLKPALYLYRAHSVARARGNPATYFDQSRRITGQSRRTKREAAKLSESPKTQENRKNSIKVLGGLFAISAGVGLGAGLIKAIFSNSSLGTNSNPDVSTSQSQGASSNKSPRLTPNPPIPASNINFVADVVDKISPSVVYLEVAGRNFVPLVGELVNVTNGSGFIISSDGLILTNAHVVGSILRAPPSPKQLDESYSGGHAEKGKVKVKLHNEKVYEGVVETVGTSSDLAAVRIKARNLPVIKLAERETRLGEFVVAAGSPFFLSNSVSFGVVSGLKRDIHSLGKSQLQEDFEKESIGKIGDFISNRLGGKRKQTQYIQTDAAVNTGNSGGPLVNMDGEVVGVCSMTVGSPGPGMAGPVPTGISFAIPVSDVRKFMESPAFKAAEARFKEILEDLHFYNFNFDLDVTQGALISGVYVGSPAHESGLRPGDIVTKLNGKIVAGAGDILSHLNESEKLDVTVLRENAELNFMIETEEVLPQ